jgi:hypothetical protein
LFEILLVEINDRETGGICVGNNRNAQNLPSGDFVGEQSRPERLAIGNSAIEFRLVFVPEAFSLPGRSLAA